MAHFIGLAVFALSLLSPVVSIPVPDDLKIFLTQHKLFNRLLMKDCEFINEPKPVDAEEVKMAEHDGSGRHTCYIVYMYGIMNTDKVPEVELQETAVCFYVYVFCLPHERVVTMHSFNGTKNSFTFVITSIGRPYFPQLQIHQRLDAMLQDDCQRASTRWGTALTVNRFLTVTIPDKDFASEIIMKTDFKFIVDKYYGYRTSNLTEYSGIYYAPEGEIKEDIRAFTFTNTNDIGRVQCYGIYHYVRTGSNLNPKPTQIFPSLNTAEEQMQRQAIPGIVLLNWSNPEEGTMEDLTIELKDEIRLQHAVLEDLFVKIISVGVVAPESLGDNLVQKQFYVCYMKWGYNTEEVSDRGQGHFWASRTNFCEVETILKIENVYCNQPNTLESAYTAASYSVNDRLVLIKRSQHSNSPNPEHLKTFLKPKRMYGSHLMKNIDRKGALQCAGFSEIFRTCDGTVVNLDIHHMTYEEAGDIQRVYMAIIYDPITSTVLRINKFSRSLATLLRTPRGEFLEDEEPFDRMRMNHWIWIRPMSPETNLATRYLKQILDIGKKSTRYSDKYCEQFLKATSKLGDVLIQECVSVGIMYKKTEYVVPPEVVVFRVTITIPEHRQSQPQQRYICVYLEEAGFEEVIVGSSSKSTNDLEETILAKVDRMPYHTVGIAQDIYGKQFPQYTIWGPLGIPKASAY